MATVHKIAPFLWFDGKAEEAAKLYTSIFPDSKIISSNPMTAQFELCGVEFMALNGGPDFKFSEAVSFFVKCKDQAEVDYFWSALTADGGEESQCGWLKDKFGLSWQVVPAVINDLVAGPDPEGSKRAMAAMLKMKKLDIKQLQDAYDGK